MSKSTTERKLTMAERAGVIPIGDIPETPTPEDDVPSEFNGRGDMQNVQQFRPQTNLGPITNYKPFIAEDIRNQVPELDKRVLEDIANPQPLFPAEIMDFGALRFIRDAFKDRNEVCLPYQFAGAIVTLGATMGRSVFLKGARPLYPNIYAILVGDTAVARKSTAKELFAEQCSYINEGVTNLEEDEGFAPLEMRASIDTGEGMINDIATHAPVKVDADKDEDADEDAPPPEPYTEVKRIGGKGALGQFEGIRLLYHIDEMRTLLKKRHQRGSTLITSLTEAYSNPREMANTSKSAPQIAKYPSVSLIGCSTQEWLEKGLEPEDISGGFANRFLFFQHERMPYVPDADDLESQAIGKWQNHVRDLRLAFGGEHIQFVMDDDVITARREFYPVLMDALYETNDEMEKFALSSWDEHLRKLMLLFALLDDDVDEDKRRVITSTHWNCAVAVNEYLMNINHWLFGEMVVNTNAEHEKRVMRQIVKHGGEAKRWQISKNIRKNTMSDEEIDKTLEALVRAEKLDKLPAGRVSLYRIRADHLE